MGSQFFFRSLSPLVTFTNCCINFKLPFGFQLSLSCNFHEIKKTTTTPTVEKEECRMKCLENDIVHMLRLWCVCVCVYVDSAHFHHIILNLSLAFRLLAHRSNPAHTQSGAQVLHHHNSKIKNNSVATLRTTITANRTFTYTHTLSHPHYLVKW